MKSSPLKTQFTSPDASPGFLLWRLTNKWQARQRQALVGFGLTHVQFVLLAALVWGAKENSPTQAQLATNTQVDAMMASQVIRRLEDKGLVKRASHSGDKRAIIVTPTARGIALVNRAIVAVEAVDEAFFVKEGIDLPELVAMLRRLIDVQV